MKDKLNLDYELELEILNYSLRHRDFWLTMLNSLEATYFDNKITKTIFIAFSSYFEKYNTLPSEKVLTNRLQKVNIEEQLYTKPLEFIYNQEISDKDREYLFDEVKSFAKRARMSNALWKSVDLLQEGKFDEINELVKDALLFNADINIGSDIWDIDKRYEHILNVQQNKIKSGWSFLDKLLGGGWEKKTLSCFGAPPGVGKSIFLVNCGVNALINNYNTVIYTLEISEERLGMRFDACLSRIPSFQLKTTIDDLKTKMDEIKARTKGRLFIKEFPTKKANVNTFRAHLEKLKVYHEFVPDLILVDYADIMAPIHHYGSRYEELGSIYEDLRGLAVEMEVPIVTASQTNRESMNKDGGTRETISGALVADSLIKLQILDFFATISQSQDQRGQNKLSLYIAKNRNGEAHQKIHYDIDYSTFKLTQLMGE